ncbi:MAG TPA: SAM-dependent methyltransferase, partial [Marmoricola sp.]|nr:SAM-dependent methyltransferase [Marmoricola sp.]
MAEPLLRALSRVRSVLLDESGLIRAVASGRQRSSAPNWRRVELRYVDLNAGRRLQEVRYDATQAFTANYAPGEQSRDAIDALLDEPFGNWHVETTDSVIQLRVTKRG